MKYKKAMEYIEECAGYGIVPGLENIKNLMERLGNPQNHLKFVHIAGTNGKGSVMNFVSSVLTENGYKTGSYHSPAVFDYCEKFQIGKKPISKAELGRIMEEIAIEAEKMKKETGFHPTPFEIETALAFLYFARRKCDIVVIETGMGGRLDATNIIPSPLVCILTPIAMDHNAYLGNTIEEIALHKAGIMKMGSIVVSAAQEKEVAFLFKEIAREVKVKELVFVEKKNISNIKYGITKQSFLYHGKKIEISIPGIWQIENAVLAYEAILALKKQGFELEEEKTEAAFKKSEWPGRFQMILKKPGIIIDGAHNIQAVRELKKSVEFYFTNKKIIYIIGMFRDKDYKESVSEICAMADHVITVPTKGDGRALTSYDLAVEVLKVNPVVTAVDSVREAVELGLLLADSNTVIIAFGSLSYLGELVEAVKLVTVQPMTNHFAKRSGRKE